MTVKDVILTIAIMLGAGLVCQLDRRLRADPAHARPALGRGAARPIGLGCDRRSARLDGCPAPPVARRVIHPLPRRAPALDAGPESGGASGSRCSSVPGVVITALIAGSVAAIVFGLPLTSGPADRRRSRPDRSGDPHPALRAARPAAEGLADDHRGVGAERSDGRGARARRSPASSSAGGASLTSPYRTSSSDLVISTALGVVFGIVLPPPCRAGERASGVNRRDRRHGRDPGGLLLHRLRRRKRLPGRVSRRTDRRQHGTAAARDALRATSATCACSSRRSPT